MAMKVIEISAPEYKIDSKPDYMAVGTKIDRLIGSSFEDGKYVVRAIGSSDHPGKSLDEVAEIILKLGTDKYDPDRKEVGDFSAYNHHFQGSSFEIAKGKLAGDERKVYVSVFGDIVYHFYEYTPFDRGYPVRIDILMIYHADKLEPAKPVNVTASRVREDLEQYMIFFESTTDGQAGSSTVHQNCVITPAASPSAIATPGDNPSMLLSTAPLSQPGTDGPNEIRFT